MTFDSHSLERLKQLGRKLPKQISESQPTDNKNHKRINKQKLHPVETETNPEQLFRELIEISTDGNVPPHLIDRLKKIESEKVNFLPDTDFTDLPNNESLHLYTQFKQFLLEDEID